MAGRKAGQRAFDWVTLGAKIPAEYKPNYNAFRNRYEAVKAAMSAYPASPDPINWEYYKAKISKPGFVDSFKKQVTKLETRVIIYDALNIPYPEDKRTNAINEREKDVDKKCEELIKEAKERATSLQQKLAEIRAQKPFEQMTLQEYLKSHPEIVKQVEKEIAEHKYNI